MNLTSLKDGLANKLESAQGAAGLTFDRAVLYIQKEDNHEPSPSYISQRTAQILQGGPGALKDGNTDGFYAITVQFNPSSIEFYAHADKVKVKTLQVQGQNEIPKPNVRPPSVTMTVELIFDDVENSDAFLVNNLTPGVMNIAKTGLKLLTGREEHTVQPQTNAMVGMLMEESTRMICFRWGDLAFAGEVVNVEAKYTMFNPKGNPIRSVVSLTIVQRVDEDDQINYWESAFDNFFGQSNESKETNMGQTVDKAKNLLNVRLF